MQKEQAEDAEDGGYGREDLEAKFGGTGSSLGWVEDQVL